MIPEVATAMAAMRTGKIDTMGGSGGGNPTAQEAESLADSNPEIVQYWIPNPGLSLEFRCDKEPFTDIRVRKAMQMSIDRKTIAATIWRGIAADGVPAGLTTPEYKGWAIPYDEWPEELQEEYSYNPGKAKELLAEAGYPDGFNTNVVCAGTDNLEFLQVAKSYLQDIGINMEINSQMDIGTFFNYVMAGKHDQMALTNTCGTLHRPDQLIQARSSTKVDNFTYNNDAHYDELVAQFQAATTLDEAKAIYNEAELYAISQHWALNVFPYNNPVFLQPYVKGSSGERTIDTATIWIDQTQKQSLGY
jgi:peptide/nickel transport system substrate-binding protein